MNCYDFRKKVNRFADGELSEPSLSVMREHAAGCSACRRRLLEIRGLSAVLASDPMPEVPPGFSQTVMNKARPAGASRPASVAWFHPGWWNEMTLPARAAAVVLLMAGIGVGTFMGWEASQAGKSPSAATQQDTVAQYGLDYFMETPSGSLAQVYLAMAK
jgi:anti-sigma factor RsiW